MSVLFKQRKTARTIAAWLLASLLALIPAVQSFASEPGGSEPSGKPLTPENAEAFLDSFFASPEAQPHYIGAAAIIVKDGEVVASKGYGYADQASETPVDPANTVFRMASVSKTFTAAAIMQLAEQGKLDLEGDIRDYIGDIEFDNPFGKPVTVADLLTHRSGFDVRDPKPEDLSTDLNRYISIEDYVRENMPPVVREPGSVYMYDNFAYLLLGLIVQNVSGEPYETYMERHIFEPLGMENSGFLLEGKLLKNLATGYDAMNKPLEIYGYAPTVMPHGGMLSTAEDIGKFMIAMLDEGKAPEGRILSESSVEAMLEYRSAIHPLFPDSTYGFEAAPQLPQAGSSAAVVTKAGDLPGNSSGLMLIPEEETGVFITYNKQGALRNLFYQKFVAEFFPEYAAPAELEPFEPASREELEVLSGLYADLRLRGLVTTVTVTEDGMLTVSDAYLGPRTLRQVDDNLFVDDITQSYTAFLVDEANETVYMKEPYLNPLGYAQKGEEPAGFSDIPDDHPYAQYIHSLQSLGLYPNEPGLAFHPEEPVKRGELVRDLLVSSGLRGSASKSYGFPDIEGHPDAAYIQAALELGMVQGTGGGKFEPNRPATRQEAAVMVWNLSRALYPDELFADVALTGETADWALPAVKMMVGLGLYGPEVQPAADGAADFLSTKPMTRQEEAAFLYKLLTQPVNQIVAELAAQKNAAGPETEPDTETEAPAAGNGQSEAETPGTQEAAPQSQGDAKAQPETGVQTDEEAQTETETPAGDEAQPEASAQGEAALSH